METATKEPTLVCPECSHTIPLFRYRKSDGEPIDQYATMRTHVDSAHYGSALAVYLMRNDEASNRKAYAMYRDRERDTWEPVERDTVPMLDPEVYSDYVTTRMIIEDDPRL